MALYNGTFLGSTVTGGFQDILTVINGASSEFYIAGSATSGAAGTSDTGISSIYLGNDAFSTPMNGKVCEWGGWQRFQLDATL
jgi:hypothetical protein